MTQKPTVILPGGAGLVGQNLVVRLIERGYQDIVVMDKHRHNLALLKRLHPGVRCLEVDVSRPGDWQSLVTPSSVVVMLQAQIGGLDEGAFYRNNVASTQCVLDAMRKGQARDLVHISSSVVNSVAHDFYSMSKREQEKKVLDSGFDPVVLRPTLMFGWFDRKHLGWLSRFMAKVPVFPIPGSGRYVRQPLYVGDFCELIIQSIEKKVAPGIYNISGLEYVNYIDIIRAIKRVTGAQSLIVRIPYSLFYLLLYLWGLFDRDPPFTTQQLSALVAQDDFEVMDWPALFGVRPTPFAEALKETFLDPRYSGVVLEF